MYRRNRRISYGGQDLPLFATDSADLGIGFFISFLVGNTHVVLLGLYHCIHDFLL